MVDYLANRSYCVTLGGKPGQIKTLIEHPFSMTHSARPPSRSAALRNGPEGIRLSIGLEDWHDIIRDLELALGKGVRAGSLSKEVSLAVTFYVRLPACHLRDADPP